MKKMFAMIFLVAFSFAIQAQNYTDIKVSQLPQAAKDYVKQSMPNAKITRAVQLDDKGVIKYGVAFENRGKTHVLIFDKDGKFLQKGDKLAADSKSTTQANPSGTNPNSRTTQPTNNPGMNSRAIPAAQLPSPIQTYLKTNFPEARIITTSKLTQKSINFYQVKLFDGTKNHVLTFNNKGSYLSKKSYVEPTNKKTGTTTPPTDPPVKEEKKVEKPSTGAAPSTPPPATHSKTGDKPNTQAAPQKNKPAAPSEQVEKPKK